MLKNNKALCEDNINAELIKISTPKMFSEICTLVKEIWKKEQGKSTTDHIFTIRQALEKYYEFGKEVHLCFVDFSQAYDSINRNKLWRTLEEFEIPSKLIQLIK